VRLLTLARDLRRRRARERHGLFVAEGVRTVEELLGADLEVRGLLAVPALAAAERGAALLAAAERRGVSVQIVDEAAFATAADTEAPQGVLAIGVVPRRALDDPTVAAGTRLLVLDAVQDPGNVGTILRTAAAFGVAATLALPGTVDLWNAKVVRSAMGALFRLPTLSTTTAGLAGFLAEHDVPLWAADAHGEPLAERQPPARLAVAVGNEGAGLSDELRPLAARLVAIPIAADVESLNVAVAAGILLHSLRP
jgi:TrmH family RNA methyltransferase